MESTSQKIVAKFLRELAKSIGNLRKEQYDNVINGNFKIEIKVDNLESKSKSPKTKRLFETEDIIEIESLLRDMSSREKGTALLKDRCTNKDSLIRVAKHLDLPVQKKEKIDAIIEKIVENTIGFKLRSQSIQGRTNSEVKWHWVTKTVNFLVNLPHL